MNFGLCTLDIFYWLFWIQSSVEEPEIPSLLSRCLVVLGFFFSSLPLNNICIPHWVSTSEGTARKSFILRRQCGGYGEIMDWSICRTMAIVPCIIYNITESHIILDFEDCPWMRVDPCWSCSAVKYAKFCCTDSSSAMRQRTLFLSYQSNNSHQHWTTLKKCNLFSFFKKNIFTIRMLGDDKYLHIVIVFYRRNGTSQSGILWVHDFIYQNTY